MEQQKLAKSLASVIDEVLEELDVIKKSQRFSATEIDIKGPGEGIAGKPSNGNIDGAKKAEDDDDEDEKDEAKKAEDDDDDEDEKDEAKKSEDDDDDEDDDKEEKDVKKGVLEEKDDNADAAKKLERSLEEGAFYRFQNGVLVKTEVEVEEEEELDKSDDKIAQLEEKLSKMNDLLKAIGDQPVDRKGVPSYVQPLTKNDDIKPLIKSELASQLFELKKSGGKVLTEDIAKVECGNDADLREVADKYNIK